MLFTLTELRCREVVNIRDGQRLGFVGDAVIDASTGRVSALTVPCRSGIFAKCGDISLPWDSIRRIGDDLILADFDVPSAKRR